MSASTRNCGAPVEPAFKRAEGAIAANPGMSNTQIAAMAGVNEKTVRRAKKAVSANAEDETSIDNPPRGPEWIGDEDWE